MKVSQAFPFFILFFVFLCCSAAQHRDPPLSIIELPESPNRTHQWRSPSDLMTPLQETRLKFSRPMVMAGVLCFIASSISSAGGIGGGGLFIPILTIVAGLELRTASSFSAFMVTGGSIANVICSLFIKSSKFGSKCLIDYEIALLSEPCMLLGVSLGVICNQVFPEWLITVLFAIFLIWSSFKTCANGIGYWKLESEEGKFKLFEQLEENGSVGYVTCERTENSMIMKEPLLGTEGKRVQDFSWMKLGILILIWFSFFIVYLLRGNRYGQGIVPVEPCGPGYWILSSLQIPLAIAFTSWILFRKESLQCRAPTQKDIDDGTNITPQPSSKLIFPTMALLAGVLGGVFGIGGGMLISPLLLHVGIAPEITAATCSFMVFFSSVMTALQYLLLDMEHTDIALVLSLICFFASFVGLIVVQRAIKEFGRASLIVFSVSIVLCLSTVLMTGFGVFHVWEDYVSGKSMGFKSPC